jgi:hypothetical protein
MRGIQGGYKITVVYSKGFRKTARESPLFWASDHIFPSRKAHSHKIRGNREIRSGISPIALI